MKILGVIYICPECRKTKLYVPDDEGVVHMDRIYCADDGYSMKVIAINEMVVDQLLKGQVKGV
jgi:uncharacterized protein YbaR (Trm112 family)